MPKPEPNTMFCLNLDEYYKEHPVEQMELDIVRVTANHSYSYEDGNSKMPMSFSELVDDLNNRCTPIPRDHPGHLNMELVTQAFNNLAANGKLLILGTPEVSLDNGNVTVKTQAGVLVYRVRADGALVLSSKYGIKLE